MYDELIKEYNILIAKESYEAFTYFRQGNKAILKLVHNKKYDIEQYLGHKFLYDCENYAIKFKELDNAVCEVIITKYKIENNKDIVTSQFGFVYDFINEKILRYTILSNDKNKLLEEEVKKVFR